MICRTAVSTPWSATPRAALHDRISFPELTTTGEQFTDEKLGIVLAPGSDDLRRAVNAALWKIEDSGEYARLYRQWFGEAAAAPAPRPPRRALFDPGPGLANVAFLVRGVWMTAVLAAIGPAPRPADRPGAGARAGAAVAAALGPGRRLRRDRSRHAAARADPVHLLRAPGLRRQPAGLHSGIIALTLNSAAYLAEIFRAGIESIEAGQMEAARSLGMTYSQAMRRVILPQTFRRVLPPLTNEGIALLKDSSLVSVIGLTELARTGQELASRYAAPLTIWPLVALLYLL